MFEQFSNPHLSASDIASRVNALGKEITQAYQANDPPMLLGVMKGSFLFLADLCRAIDLPCPVDFIRAQSYQGTQQSDSIKLWTDVEIKNRRVLIVEDILDSGKSLSAILERLNLKGAKDIKICCLLDKEKVPKEVINPDFVGFVVADKWWVGYGLDHNGLYRNLPFVVDLPEHLK